MIWNRQKKNVTRQLAEPKTRKLHSLWLPGVDCLDVINAYEKGLLSSKGKHIIVERDKSCMEQIKLNLSKIKLDFHYHADELYALKLKTPLDYAHFDFCGAMTNREVYWFYDELKLNTLAEIHFTMAYAIRNNQFLKSTFELFKEKEPYKSLMRYYHYELSRDDSTVCFFCVFIQSLLNGWEYVSCMPIKYKDTVQSMVLYRCLNLTPNHEMSCFNLDAMALSAN